MTICLEHQTLSCKSLIRVAALGVCVLALLAQPAAADDPPLVDLETKESGAGLGFALRSERSMYRGGGTRNDLVPIYLYEGKRLFLESYRGGIRLDQSAEHRFEVFLARRFEGFPYDRIPVSLAGMAERGHGLDMGIAYQRRGPWGMAFAELLRDASRESRGTEARVGYRYDLHVGSRLTVRPQIAVSVRDAKLNDYYYHC